MASPTTAGLPAPAGVGRWPPHLTDDPEVRYTEAGIASEVFRVAVPSWREQEPSLFTVIVWRDQAEHAAESLSKGSRVVVVGRLQQRTWTAQDGSARSTVEVVADELGQACGGRQRLTLAGWREDLVVPDRLSLKPSVGLAALTTLTLVSPG